MILWLKKRFKIRYRFLIPFLMLLVNIPVYGQVNNQKTKPELQSTLIDSLLNTFSLEDLARFKEYYQNEINLFEHERKLERDKGIEDGEKILAINPNGQFMDKVLFRLAEFYYIKEQDELFNRMEEYEVEFAEYEEGKRSELPAEPKPDYSNVIDKYETIVNNFPNSKLMDDVLYHLAFTYDKNFESEKAINYYMQVADRFPESRNAPEALIRIGEYYFDPERRDLDLAIQNYMQVLNYKETPRYDEALYKLGWCYYLQEKFDESIETFSLLVQDIENNSRFDPFGEYTNPSLKEEALEYIGICFHDKGSLEEALAFIDDQKRPAYCADILIKMGDINREHEEKFSEAIVTYMALLERFPFHEKAPEIQEKIVLSARRLEDNQEIYIAQQQLFDNYNPNSEWYSQISSQIEDTEKLRQVLDMAYEKSEFALRDNINLSIRLGEESADQSYYELAVNNAKKYLETFPLDTNAYTIHWNSAVLMDTKLNQKEDAYQAYLDVCNNYVQDKFRKPAAQNAIVLARELSPEITTPDSSAILADSGLPPVQADSLNQMKENVNQPNETENRLIVAYNNFIKHFPNEEETAVVLGNVGNIYYGQKDFNNALKYFNTLIRRYPDSPTSQEAQLTAMESYFGKRDFASTEVVAKKIRNREDLPEEFKEKAEKRLAESIYLHAEALAGDDKNLESANEFKRMIEEVPDAVFADKALFQAGVQFDKAKEFSRAIEMYTQLTNRFSASEHYLDAVNNLALDYAELKEFLLAARTYEKLSESHPDSSRSQDALYNSSYFYVQAEDWRNSIRINRSYVDKYPTAPDAEDMFYNMAEYYLKLDDYDHANEIYGEFAANYPESPRTVETYFKRGDYFKGKGRLQDAFAEFDLALAKNKELKAKGLDANDFYAAEALFSKSEEQYKDFMSIKFTRANLNINQEKKKELLQQLVQQYQEVAKFATIRIYEALYKAGRLYENFAETWAKQELPSLSETEKIVFMNNLNQNSSQLYDKAFDSYKTTYKTLTKLVESYKPAEKDTSDTKSLRVTAEDSTIRVADRWINLTGSKISEMLYRIADLNSSSIESFLNAPLPEGLDEVSLLEYRNQVLAKAVFPIVQTNAQAHLRNLNEADSLQLVNEWVNRSQQKLSDVMSVLPDQYKQLCLDAFDSYQIKYRDYTKIMTEGTIEEKENAIDLAGKMVNIIELGKNYANLMIANYKASIDRLIQNSNGQMLAQSLFTDCINTTVQLADNFNQAAIECRKMKDNFTILNQNDPQMIYEDAIYTYSDGNTYLKDNALAICETTYNLKKEYDFQSIGFAKLATLLVELNPETYAPEFELAASDVNLDVDESWLMSIEKADSNWTRPEFTPENWSSAFIKNDSTLLSFTAQTDTIKADSSANIFSDSVVVNRIFPEKFFLRKEVNLNDIPLSATLSLNADDNVWVYLNGIEVFTETKDEFGWGNVFETDLTPYLKQGKNVLAVQVEDKDRSGNGVQPKLKLKTIFRDALVQQEQKLMEKELGEMGISDLNEMIFNRYLVPK